MNRRFVWIFAFVLLVALVASFQGRPTNGESLSATYSRGTLHVSIPSTAPHPGPGTLTVDVLDPSDVVLAHAERRVDASGAWQEDLTLAKPLAIDDLVWQRVRYRFTYADGKNAPFEETESISQILRMPVIRILGQQTYLAGGSAAVRVVVTDSRNEPIAGTGSVRVELDGRTVFTGPVNRRGASDARFRFPATMTGSHTLHYIADTALGSTEVTQQVRIEDKASILLTTEKPLYQPGQTIHVRALALDRANHQATARRPLTFELEDSRGNKVFKKATETSAYGIASAEFSLATEVNLGTYHLRAIMENNRAELALNVERYVLPKFKVAIEFTGKAAHGYRPGDHVTGTVHANYFFGKPVDAGEVTVKASAMDVAIVDSAPSQGKTDADGAYKFDLTLPSYFAGNPLDHGAIRALVQATVKDTAGHSEMRGEPVTVSQSPLLITAVPEGGTLIPNLENQVFVLTSYADGKPAATTVKVHGESVNTDAGGVAVVRMAPGPGAENLQIEASDAQGNRASTSLQLQVRQGPDQILLRTERAVYRAGDSIQLKVFATKPRGAAYVDVIKDGQTVLTRDLDIVDGQATLTIPATPDLAGTLDCNAYLFGRDARPIGDHRLLFVQPADELKIEATADGAVYKPGDDARIRFRVTNSHGEGVQAALGLQVVDEAVFALAEKQPGFAKVFFYLEQEAMKPRYEIHSIGMPDVVEPVVALQNQAARALFAATEMVNTNGFETEAGRSVSQVKFAEYMGAYHTRFVEQARSQLAGGLESTDAWGGKLSVTSVSYGGPGKTYMVRSAGPDKQLNSADDLYAYLSVREPKVVARANSGPSGIDINIEHDRGPYNGRADISGVVADPKGGAVEGVSIAAREMASGQMRSATTDSDGAFRFSAVPAGDYQITVADGSVTANAKVTLNARDRAVLSAHLQVASGKIVVTQPLPAPAARPMFAMQAGMAGAVREMAFARKADMPLNDRVDMVEARAEAATMLAVNGVVDGKDLAVLKKMSTDTSGAAKTAAAARVRSYFPEALYINPEIITDQHGVASITIPDGRFHHHVAHGHDGIHRAAALLGSGTSQPQGLSGFLRRSRPAGHPHAGRPRLHPDRRLQLRRRAGDVSLQLQPADWFTLAQDIADKIADRRARPRGRFAVHHRSQTHRQVQTHSRARIEGRGQPRRHRGARNRSDSEWPRAEPWSSTAAWKTPSHHTLNFPAGRSPMPARCWCGFTPGRSAR